MEHLLLVGDYAVGFVKDVNYGLVPCGQLPEYPLYRVDEIQPPVVGDGRISAVVTSSRVALKDSISSVGSFFMKPTVSVNSTLRFSDRGLTEVLVSRVAKGISAAKASLPVSALRRVDFPAFV